MCVSDEQGCGSLDPQGGKCEHIVLVHLAWGLLLSGKGLATQNTGEITLKSLAEEGKGNFVPLSRNSRCFSLKGQSW